MSFYLFIFFVHLYSFFLFHFYFLIFIVKYFSFFFFYNMYKKVRHKIIKIMDSAELPLIIVKKSDVCSGFSANVGFLPYFKAPWQFTFSIHFLPETDNFLSGHFVSYYTVYSGIFSGVCQKPHTKTRNSTVVACSLSYNQPHKVVIGSACCFDLSR